LIDAADVVLDGVIRYDVRFFESLNRMVQAEPWLERDRAMIDGSVDVYFAPKSSERQRFELDTDRRRRKIRSALPSLWSREGLLRKKWVLPDIEKVN
jgi:hypothetical protein